MKFRKPSPELSEQLGQAMMDFAVEKRKMFGCPAFFVNRNMFCGVFADSIFLRLSEEDRERVQEEFDEVSVFEPMEGRKMREYMALPAAVYDDEGAFREWLDRSFAFVSALPPKPEKKRKGKNK